MAIMLDQLDAEERAWIRAEPKIGSPLTFTDGNSMVQLEIEFTLRNAGRSAGYALVNPELYFTDSKGYILAPNGQQDTMFCGVPNLPGHRPKNPDAKSLTVFPGDTSGPISIKITSPVPPGTFIQPQPMLIGCVYYQHSEREEFHQTGFIYSIVITEPDTPDISPLFTVGKIIPSARLNLRRWEHGGDWAHTEKQNLPSPHQQKTTKRARRQIRRLPRI